MQAAGQFTPDQLITAARRAEAQGQPSYAVQFYRYLADHFPQSTEAYEARDALFRLTPPVPEQGVRQSPATGYASAAPGAALGDVRPTGPAAAEPVRAEARPRRRRAAEEPEAAPARGHRIGRFVAAMLNTIGWLMLVIGIAAVPLIAAGLTMRAFPKALRETIAGNVLLFAGGTFGLLLIGLFSIFAAQVARAAFDTADAVRALRAE